MDLTILFGGSGSIGCTSATLTQAGGYCYTCVTAPALLVNLPSGGHAQVQFITDFSPPPLQVIQEVNWLSE